MPRGIELAESHGRTRVAVRLDQVPALPSADTAPMQDPRTGRFLPGNRAHRRRQLQARAKGVASLNPATCPSWMRSHVEAGAGYVVALVGMLEGKPALHPLAGDCADAHALYRATLALALQAEDVKGRLALMAEARGWLREHRTSLATLASLAGDIELPEADPLAPWQRPEDGAEDDETDEDEPTDAADAGQETP